MREPSETTEDTAQRRVRDRQGLPALMLLPGDRVWHVPATLDRLLPRFDFHAAPADDPIR